MAYRNRQLLFTDDFYFDESLIGYVMRLAELNDIPDIHWILRLIRSSKNYRPDYRCNFDFGINLSTFSQLTGIDKENLECLLYRHQYDSGRYASANLLVFDQPIRQNLICRENPKICPQCLNEANYCRKVWEFALVTACPVHGCLLLDYCSDCFTKLDWNRPQIHLCQCGSDLRILEGRPLAENELRLSNYFHQNFGLPYNQADSGFNSPLKTLPPEKLIKLLCFTLTYSTRSSNYKAQTLSIFYLENELTHRFMCAGVEIFDNWAINYHEFIESWVEQYKDKLSIRKPPYAPRFCLPYGYEEYETMNYVLREYFTKKEFPFLYREFVKFLKNLPIISTNSYELDYL